MTKRVVDIWFKCLLNVVFFALATWNQHTRKAGLYRVQESVLMYPTTHESGIMMKACMPSLVLRSG